MATPSLPPIEEPAIVETTVAKAPPQSQEPPELWYFEWLSQDGKRALLRRLDANAKSVFQARIVDVDTGSTIEEESLDELGRVPTPGHSGDGTDLDTLFESSAFAADLVRGAQVSNAFPFGTLGRFSAAPNGNAIAFNAGDALFVADKSGAVKKRLAAEAAYDPRFTPDGKHILFRRATGKLDKVFAKYELFAVPADLSAPPKVIPGTAGTRDRFVETADGSAAIAIASHEPHIKTCALSVGLRPPFNVKKLACLEGGEELVESVLSPKGKWAALTTQTEVADESSSKPERNAKRFTKSHHWRLRVVSLKTGKVDLDETAQTGLSLHAISDTGVLVQSGPAGIVVDDVEKKIHHTLGHEIDLGYRGFFRGAHELVFVRGASVGVADLSGELQAKR